MLCASHAEAQGKGEQMGKAELRTYLRLDQILDTEPDTLYANVLKCQKLLEELLERMAADPECDFTMFDKTPTHLRSLEQLLRRMRQSVRRSLEEGASLSPISEELYRYQLFLAEALIRGHLRLYRGQELVKEAVE